MKHAAGFINSTIAFVIASIAEMSLHECGHFVAALAFKGQPVLYHNYVTYPALAGEYPHIVTALAGPAVSLVIGIGSHCILQNRSPAAMVKLVILYLSFFGYAGFFGYLMVAPFFSYGDTGYALRALECPEFLITIIAVLAAAVMFLVSKMLSRHFVSFMSSRTAAVIKYRSRFIFSLVLFPLLAGVSITTLLNLPVPTTLSLIAPLTSPFVILWPFHYYLRLQGIPFDDAEVIDRKVSVSGLVIMVVVVGLNRLLTGGVHF